MTQRSTEENPATHRIGHWLLIKRLAVSGSAELWLAMDEEVGQEVAVRSVTLDNYVTPRELRLIRREIEQVSQLQCPGFVRIHDTVAEAKSLHVITEYVAGPSLRAELKSTAYSQAKVVAIALEVLEALLEAHARGLIHRALHAGQLRRDAKGLRVLGLGFGVLHVPDNLSRLEHLVAMSPEQLRSEKVDHRTDFFALGGMIYELMTRQNPFIGANREDTLYRLLHVRPQPLAQGFPGTHPKLSAVVDWLLQKDPEHRPETGADVVVILREVARDLGPA